MAARRQSRSKKPHHGLYVRRVVADNVKRLRDQRGMSQEELADAANLNQSEISDIENAKSNIRLDIVQSLAAGLSARLAELFEEAKSG